MWNVVGRLRDGVSLGAAQAELATLASRQAETARVFAGITVKAEPLRTELNREGRRLLSPLLGAVALVFVMACANAAGLLLVWGLQRQREFAVRCALGAQRSRLLRQVLTEVGVLTASAGLLGAGLALAPLQILKIGGQAAIPRLEAVTVGWPAFAFAFALAVMAAFLVGWVPAWHASRSNGVSPIQGAAKTSSASRGERRLLRAVAVLQTSLTLALLVGAGLLVRTAMNLARVRPGYDTQNVLTLSVTDMNLLNFFGFHGQALERVSALPGVTHVAFAWGVPLTGNRWTTTVLEIEGQANLGGLKDTLTIPSRSVTPGYFELMGQKIVAGRGFSKTYSTETNRTVVPQVAIVNQAMAGKYFSHGTPIGRKFRSPGGPGGSIEIEIIGVVTDARTESLALRPEPELYFSLWEAFPFTKHLIVRTASDPVPLVGAIQRELREIEPTVAVENVKTLGQIRSDSIAPRTFAMRLLVGFSAVACVLAFVGIFGVLSLSVNSRRRELAIRTAVGAQRRDIRGLVFGEALRVIAAGLGLGMGMAACLVYALRALLYGVEPTDLPTLIGAPMLLSVIAVLAAWRPAQNATKVDPMEALRHE